MSRYGGKCLTVLPQVEFPMSPPLLNRSHAAAGAYPAEGTEGYENGPGRDLRGPFPLVALSQFSPNTLLTHVQDDASVTNQSSRFVSPPLQRRRITARLRATVVEIYASGKTSRQVAEELGLGRTTVLQILKAAGVTVRPQGRKY